MFRLRSAEYGGLRWSARSEGCSVPMILRKEGLEDTLVEESFVTVMMDGEVTEDIRQGKSEMQTLVIR
jgi:hypothetical protein